MICSKASPNLAAALFLGREDVPTLALPVIDAGCRVEVTWPLVGLNLAAGNHVSGTVDANAAHIAGVGA